MTIIQIGPYPTDSSLIRGGVEASVYGLATEQCKSSKVYVIDIPRLDSNDTSDEISGITVFRFHNPGPHQKDSRKRVDDILRLIRDLEPDICHVHGTGFFSWEIIQKLHKHAIPTILTVHGLAGVEKRKAFKQHLSLRLFYQYITQLRCEKRLLSHVDRIIVDTEYVEKAIRGYHLRKIPQMVIIPQGIQQDYFELNCSPESDTIISVGSISRRKGHHLLIQSFSIVASELKNVKLIICGVLTDEKYFDELKSLVSSLPCKGRITLKTDVSKYELLGLYRNARIFALHSQEESQGLVFAEAMAAGLPIVSTRVGGIPYVVTEGKTGFLSDYGDIMSFSRSLIRLLNTDSEWSKMSVLCKERALDYSWSRVSKSISSEFFHN